VTNSAPAPRSILLPRDARIGRRGTLGAALDRLSVPPDLRAPILRLLEARIDERRLPSDTTIRVLVDERGTWRVVSVRSEPERYLEVDLPDGPGAPPSAEWVAMPMRTELRAVSGVVDSSVAQALAHHPHGMRLTMAFADIFQWDVDLLVDPRPGDRVELVYELRRLGDVPLAAPPIDGSAQATGDVLEPGRILAASYRGARAEADAFWVPRGASLGDYYDRQARPLRKTFLKSPLNYRRISSGFSRARRHPVTRRVVPHHGVDYAAAPGTPVVASADGRVVSAGWDGALGRAVRIRHGSEFVTIYGHLRGFAAGVRAGAQVRQNQVIGYVGSTGRATGPHLHYTVLRRGAAIDPLRMPNPEAPALEATHLPALARSIGRFGPMLGESVEPTVLAGLRDMNGGNVDAQP
jgi:murein DD-endopeptidase MepM/ murein hydrolase activator NlpD